MTITWQDIPEPLSDVEREERETLWCDAHRGELGPVTWPRLVELNARHGAAAVGVSR